MSIIKANGAGDQSLGFYNGVITSSCRFNGSTSKLVSPAFASDLGNTWTWSAWVKFTNQTSDRRGTLFNAVGESASLYFDNTSQDFLSVNDDGSAVCNTTRLLRDSSSWYHIVLNGNGTINKLWINGVLATFNTNPNLDGINIAVAHQIGDSPFGSNYFFDGIMADINFVSQTALDYTAFAETKNGVLIPKEPSVTYGANGFRLQFLKTGSGADANGIGADTSGNNKHFTATGLDAYDVLPDSPENNFPTWNPIAPDPTYGITTISEGNLKSLNSPANNKYSEINFRLDQTNKYYFEYYNINATTGTNPASFEIFESSSNKFAFYITTAGYIYVDGSLIGSGFPTLSAGDIVNIAFDGASGKVWFGKNGTYYNASGSATGNPADGSNPIATLTSAEFKMYSVFYQQGAIMNFGQDSTFAGNKTSGSENAQDSNGIGDFYDTVPSGFLALCTSNLPEPTIGPNSGTNEQADNYFGILTYTGNVSGQTIQSGGTGVGGEIDFTPDWVWTKARSSGIAHLVYDSVRGATKYIQVDAANQEGTGADSLTDFALNGFTVGADSSTTGVNNNGTTYVAWNWKAGDAPTASNSAGAGAIPTAGSVKIDGVNKSDALSGSIPATKISANTTAGFSIVTYTGNGTAGASVGHGLGAIPKIIIIKNRDASQAWVFNANLPTKYRMVLDTTAGDSGDFNTYMGTQTDDNIVFGGTNHPAWNGSGNGMVAYCFAEIEGYSKFGIYTGNSSSTGDGTFVYLGFKPSFVMLKDIGGGEWGMFDNTRNTFNVVNKLLQAQDSGAEYDGDTNRDLDFLSNGFKLRNGSALVFNNSARTYFYMAFAENPTKYSLAR